MEDANDNLQIHSDIVYGKNELPKCSVTPKSIILEYEYSSTRANEIPTSIDRPYLFVDTLQHLSSVPFIKPAFVLTSLESSRLI